MIVLRGAQSIKYIFEKSSVSAKRVVMKCYRYHKQYNDNNTIVVSILYYIRLRRC